MKPTEFISGVGIGLRRDLVDALLSSTGHQPAFVELAPENWMNLGGHWRRALDRVRERFAITTHGLSLSLGSPEPLDWVFLGQLRNFLNEQEINLYTEHLSYSKCDNAHLYDLLPIPFRKDAARHVAKRIRQVQDFLERKMAIEIVSYYTPIVPEMSESDFVRQVVEEADCDLLLDVNNIYVNAFNHGYNAREFISKLPLERVSYIHMAGHEQVAEDLIIDTHGQPIVDPVYELYDWTLRQIRPVPVLLERDFQIPEYTELQGELCRLDAIASKHWERSHAATS